MRRKVDPAKVLKVTSVQTPIDMAERHLKTRSMLRKRVGRPRSQPAGEGEITHLQRHAESGTHEIERLSGQETRERNDATHAGRAADEQVQTDLPRPYRRLDDRLSVVSRRPPRPARGMGPPTIGTPVSATRPVRRASSRSAIQTIFWLADGLIARLA